MTQDRLFVDAWTAQQDEDARAAEEARIGRIGVEAEHDRVVGLRGHRDWGHAWLEVSLTRWADAASYSTGCAIQGDGRVYLEGDAEVPAFLDTHPAAKALDEAGKVPWVEYERDAPFLGLPHLPMGAGYRQWEHDTQPWWAEPRWSTEEEVARAASNVVEGLPWWSGIPGAEGVSCGDGECDCRGLDPECWLTRQHAHERGEL